MNYFDLHCDTAFELYKRNLPFDNKELSVTAENSFDNWVQTFAVWIDDNAKNPFELYKKIMSDIKEKLKNKPENLMPVFSVEGGAVLENNPERIYTLAQDGIKMITLVWNGENTIGGGSKTEKGLTDFGIKVIKDLNCLKIATDLSHTNAKTFFSAVDYTELPIATHSNCFEICPHPRNLTLEQIKLIAEKNGIIGLTFYPDFLGGDIYEKIFENIYLLCSKGYENNIAIGSDFDGGKMDKALDNITKIPDLYDFLSEKGLNNSLLNKIFYQNAYKFIANLRKTMYNI